MDYFTQNNIKHIDYKDVDILKLFVSPSGKIMPRRRTKLSAKHQREIAQAVKRARFMGLLPFVAK